ncbi:MAG: 1-(5-phosphoribosyl)-5-[(5-phosphoribosylamino)methylideneamino]imidazole-4-carboxamide isomerase [Solirubrobacterales bacterium]|nr:1-(5-phosphoribosyl)-5-[(5-phosphoribosylamino)methylideneamino]imidazole-4-carboxamide isomerase [Solirubrobacterales bacterium]
MRLFPAIDLLGGKTVRLRKGDYKDEIVYEEDPADAARRFESEGASILHVVDLDGAKSGRPEQLDVVSRMVAAVDIPIELGGGLRTLDDLRSASAVGVSRLVLGTAAINNPELVDQALAEFGRALVVSVDGRGGDVAVEGWTEESGQRVVDVMARLAGQGVTQFVYSAIEKDGTLEGPGLDEIREVSATTKGSIVYAGGIGSLEDLVAMTSLRLVNVTGVIVGRALHEGKFTIAEATAALKGS